MSYKYMTASNKMVKNPKETYTEDFKERLREGFENSSDWFTIQQETSFASGEYEDINARINYVISNETGEKLSDDYKLLWFKDIEHSVQLGTYFYFNDNYWLTINTEKLKSLTNSVTVKRCNEMLKWVDGIGGSYSVPCSMADPLIRENRDYSTTGSAVVNVSGVIEIMTQFNDMTNTIKSNQRFLFGNPGNWTCYKVAGAGVNNLNRMKTEDPYSVGVVRYSIMGSQYNADTDDLVNGICDAFQYSYVVTINSGNLFLNVGEQIQLIATTTLNDKSVVRDYVWTSSDNSIAEVYGGLINPKQKGSCKVRATLKNNEDVYSEILLSVVSEPVVNSYVKIYPSDNYVLETDSKTFDVYLYNNGIQQSDVFTFAITPTGVPTTSYIFSSTSNTFTIENLKKYLDSPLVIVCTSGSNVRTVSINLKGGW